MSLPACNNNINFKGAYEFTSALDSRPMWSRAIVSIGTEVGWLVCANNSTERSEKARRTTTAFVITFLTPLLTLPFSNRFAMKYCSKLTKSFYSDNHKLIHLSNKILKAEIDNNKAAEKLKEGLKDISQNYTYSPFENLWRKISGKSKKKEKLNFDDILAKCGGDYEKLRKKLVNAKMVVLASDFLFTALTFGSMDFVNNMLTKKKTGQSGFSAEFSMADKKTVEKRAKHYEKSWKKRYAAFVGLVTTVALGIPFALKHGLNKKSASYFKNIAEKFDYNDGIYMSRLALLLSVALLGHAGALLATRNNTELKDKISRYIATDCIYFGGDLLFTSILANLCDKIFKTNIAKPAKNAFSKIFPGYKSLRVISKEVDEGKIASRNKFVSASIFWASLAAVTAFVGWGVPIMINKMIKREVNKDVKNMGVKDNTHLKHDESLPTFFKAFRYNCQ